MDASSPRAFILIKVIYANAVSAAAKCNISLSRDIFKMLLTRNITSHPYFMSPTSSRCWKSGQVKASVAAGDCSSGSGTSGARATRGSSSSASFFWSLSSLFLMTWLLSSCSSEWFTDCKQRAIRHFRKLFWFYSFFLYTFFFFSVCRRLLLIICHDMQPNPRYYRICENGAFILKKVVSSCLTGNKHSK